MSILEKIIASFAPHSCLGCFAEGVLLCRSCYAQLTPLPSRCYRCRQLTVDNRTCLACRGYGGLYRLQAGTAYRGLAKDVVWALKFAAAQAAAAEMAEYLLSRVTLPPNAFIVPVPTSTSRVRERGYDQAVLLAQEIARRSGLPYLSCLARSGRQHQRGASREQRLRQLAGAFRVTKPAATLDAHIVLVDDVITTGATLRTAALLLKSCGAKRVEAMVFAQA